MLDRRDALKTFAMGTGALLIGGESLAFAQTPKPATTATAATPPAAAPAPTGPFTLPPLPYAADALEPHLDAQTMTIHHDKHHAAYVNNLNKAVASHADLGKMKVEELLKKLDSLPADVKTAVRNQGGGHANHTLLWTSLKKNGARAPIGELKPAIDKAFGSFSGFQDKFTAAAVGVFGSGWAWLSWAGKDGLVIETLPNQDSPITAGHVPLLGIDVWEHAYYLKFQNRRPDYIAEFAKVVDWDIVSQRYRDAVKA